MDAFIPIVGMIGAVIVLDATWLTINYSYHMKLFESIQKSPLTVRLVPAILVYILIIVAVYFFAVKEVTSFSNAVLRGTALGFAMYGLYDLTNYATLTNYTLQMTLTDMTWGTVLCGLIAAVGFYLKPK
jgi:uncharacterized membrane protein